MNYNSVITPYREAVDNYDGIPVSIAGTIDVAETALLLAATLDVNNAAENFIAATLATATDFIDLIYAKNAQPRVRVFLDGAEVTSGLEGSLEITFPEDSAASFAFSLGGVAYNPFANASVDTDKAIDIRSVYTDATGTDYETQLFTGLSARIDLNVDAIDITITGLDLTRLVSRDSDRLNRELYAVDAFEEVKLADTTSQVTTTYVIATDMDQPIQGVWLESDPTRAINYYIGGSFNGNVITLGSPLPTVENVVVKYFEGDTNVVTTTRLKKSEIVEKICTLAGITSVEFPAQADEDIQSFSYIFANRELPLDIIRKITVPQTWRSEFAENGTLECRRTEIKATPDWTFDESLYDADSFRAIKDTAGVINVQTVLGGIKQQNVLVKAGQSEVFHPYQETLGERQQIGSASLSKPALPNFHFDARWFWPWLDSGSGAAGLLVEKLDVPLAGNYKNITVEPIKTVGLWADSTQVAVTTPFEHIRWVSSRIHHNINSAGTILTITISRLYQIVGTSFGTSYNMPALDVSFNVFGREVQTAAAYTDEAVPPEFATTYLQIGKEVSDLTSQDKYGVRKAGIFTSPFIETQTQCVRVAEEIIRESNKVWDVSFSIPMNPMLKRGQTVKITNTALAIDLTDTVKNVRHFFDMTTGEATTEVFIKAAEYAFVSSLNENA